MKTHKQIRPRTAQINNLRTPIAILLQPCTLEAVKSITDALATAHDAFVLVVAERALVADADQGCGPHVGVADGAFAVAFVAEATDCYAGLFAAHYEIAARVNLLVWASCWESGMMGRDVRVMARHGGRCGWAGNVGEISRLRDFEI